MKMRLSRRTTLSAILAVPCVGTCIGDLTDVPAASHPDAAILEMAPELARLHADCQAAFDVETDCEARAHAMARERVGPRESAAFATWADAIHLAKEESGYSQAELAHWDLIDQMRDVVEAVAAIPAATLDGVLVKARYARDWDDLEESVLNDLVAIDASRSA